MRTTTALFGLGNPLTGFGVLLAASVALHLDAFPQWLTVWIGFIGIVALTLFGVNVLAPTPTLTNVVWFVSLIVGLIGGIWRWP